MAEYQELANDKMGQMLTENFKRMYEKEMQPEHYSFFSELKTKYGKTGELIVYQMLNHVFDVPQEHIFGSLAEYVSEIAKGKFITPSEFASGFSKYMTHLPDYSADYPMLPQYLALVMSTLRALNSLDYKQVVLIDDKKLAVTDDASDEYVFCDEYLKLIGNLLIEEFKQKDDLKALVTLFTSSNFH